MAKAPCPELHALADDCVHAFDRFRAPLPVAELDHRRGAKLTPRQDALLARWGYPYVFDEWRFHMTLSCRLADEERAKLKAALLPLIIPLLRIHLNVDAICIFEQPHPTASFRLMVRCPFRPRI